MPALVAWIQLQFGAPPRHPCGIKPVEIEEDVGLDNRPLPERKLLRAQGPRGTTVVTGVPRHRQQLRAVENPQVRAGGGDALDKLGLEERPDHDRARLEPRSCRARLGDNFECQGGLKRRLRRQVRGRRLPVDDGVDVTKSGGE